MGGREAWEEEEDGKRMWGWEEWEIEEKEEDGGKEGRKRRRAKGRQYGGEWSQFS
jgi:hypothetical protein